MRRDCTKEPTLCTGRRIEMLESNAAVAEVLTGLMPRKRSGKVGAGRNVSKGASV